MTPEGPMRIELSSEESSQIDFGTKNEQKWLIGMEVRDGGCNTISIRVVAELIKTIIICEQFIIHIHNS